MELIFKNSFSLSFFLTIERRVTANPETDDANQFIGLDIFIPGSQAASAVSDTGVSRGRVTTNVASSQFGFPPGSCLVILI